MLYYQDLLYVLKVIRSELISRHYDNPLAGHFGIKNTPKLIAGKYYWLILQQDVKAYVKGCNIYLVEKPVCHKLYGELHLLPIPTYW